MEEDFRQPGLNVPTASFWWRTQRYTARSATRLDPQLDIVERAVERAIDPKATIEVLRG
jgi:hypothetical protein